MHRSIKGLRAGDAVDDRSFDSIYPDWIQKLSRIQWTPVEVAQKAATWLVTKPGTKVLDVGSGVGKFCLVGALATKGVFTGVEFRPHLVEVAQLVARQNSIKRCTFVAGDAVSVDWGIYDGLYLYNPFAEHLPGCPIVDDTVDPQSAHFFAYVAHVEGWLATAAIGTRVVTYHGFGGEFPTDWERAEAARMASGSLELWVRGGQS